MHIVNGATWWLEIYRIYCIVRKPHPIIKSETFGVSFLSTECGGQGNEFELIPTIKMETRHPVEIQFGCEYAVICYHCGVMAAWGGQNWNFLRFLEKWPLMIKFSKFCSNSLHRDTVRRCCAQNSTKLSDGKSVKACVIYLTNKKKTFFRLPLKLWLLSGSRPKSALASPQHLADNFPNFIQIGSLLAELLIAGRVKAIQNAP